MANEEQLAILKSGVSEWNKRRQDGNADLRRALLAGMDLRGANLRGVNLRGAWLSNVKLSEADLSGADLRLAVLYSADLIGANLNGANLSRAKLNGADFGRAHLNDALLCGAHLGGVGFRNAHLCGANFSRAWFGGTEIVDVDLSEVIDLEAARHQGPSSIGIDTLYKSKGLIPESFLRGCGVPDSFITQAAALIGAEEGIQFYSCFISYSGLDAEFASRLHGRLQQEHVRVWFAPYDIQGGKKLHEQIDEAIKVYDKLLILLSPSSLQSEWVMTELRKARKEERKTGKRKLFPVGLVEYDILREWECFDADGGQDLAVEVREYFIPDFSNWKDHDAFEVGFARLLCDLRADGKAAGRWE